MNRLRTAQRARILELLCEGNMVRGVARLERVSPVTVLKLLADAGEACEEWHDENVRDVPSAHIECDEIWCQLHVKQKRLKNAIAPPPHAGSVWTWTALDTDSKLILSWWAGDRDMDTGRPFMLDVRFRVKGRPQITTDGWFGYPELIEEAFGADVDYAMLVKQYNGKGKYVGADKYVLQGNPDMARCSTSLVERHNLTMRSAMRRYTRETNGHSKKFEFHCHNLALYFVWYNWVRPHQTLRGRTPAQAAGLSHLRFSMEQMLGLLKL